MLPVSNVSTSHNSIAQNLRRQSLIVEKNNLQAQMLANWQAQRMALQNQSLSFEGAAALDKTLAIENVNNSTQLMAVNAELQSLHSIDYMA